MLAKKLAHLQKELSKHNPAILVVRVEEIKIAQAIIFRLLRREKFDKAMKTLKAEKENQIKQQKSTIPSFP